MVEKGGGRRKGLKDFPEVWSCRMIEVKWSVVSGGYSLMVDLLDFWDIMQSPPLSPLLVVRKPAPQPRETHIPSGARYDNG